MGESNRLSKNLINKGITQLNQLLLASFFVGNSRLNLLGLSNMGLQLLTRAITLHGNRSKDIQHILQAAAITSHSQKYRIA